MKIRTEKEIRDRLNSCRITRDSPLGKQVCCLASIQVKVLEWVLGERDIIS